MATKTVGVVGSGGREHVLVKAYERSEHVGRIVVFPGHDMMKRGNKKPVITFPQVDKTDARTIAKLCKENDVDLIDVAQDNAIEAGVVDEAERNGILALGPRAQAGRIEWDKVWARRFGREIGLLQPFHMAFNAAAKGIMLLNAAEAADLSGPWFIKAAGLCEGKGALFAETNKVAIEKINELVKFGKAGEKFLIEKCLVGEEFSAFAICDGITFKILGTAQDHKRAFDGDVGPNTGGMGCSSPPLVLNDVNIQNQINSIFSRTVAGMYNLGMPYVGVLYLGGILVKEKDGLKVYVIEFNSRWGDPEAQVIVPGIKNDMFELSMSAIKGNVGNLKIETDNNARVVIAGASKGYPTDYKAVKGKEIFGLDRVMQTERVELYGAGVKVRENRYFVDGGRVFYIVGEGKDVIEASSRGYSAMNLVSIEGDNLHFRHDIGNRDVARLEGLMRN
jgi:phosphoribosylamine---glycine ligase